MLIKTIFPQQAVSVSYILIVHHTFKVSNKVQQGAGNQVNNMKVDLSIKVVLVIGRFYNENLVRPLFNTFQFQRPRFNAAIIRFNKKVFLEKLKDEKSFTCGALVTQNFAFRPMFTLLSVDHCICSCSPLTMLFVLQGNPRSPRGQ